MKAPVGLLSDRTVCVSRWRGLASTSSMQVSVEGEIRNHRCPPYAAFMSQRKAKSSWLNPSSFRFFLIRSPSRDASSAGSDSGWSFAFFTENTSFAGNHQMPRNVKVNSTGLVTSGIYSGWTLAPQLSSPPTPICSPIARMTV